MSSELSLTIPKFLRIDPKALEERVLGEHKIIGPPDFLEVLKPRYGVVVASWDRQEELGVVSRLGIVLRVGSDGAAVQWSSVDLRYRPRSQGRRFWTQAKPFFQFAPDVAQRYMLAPTFAEHFAEVRIVPAPRGQSSLPDTRPSSSPTGGYVYLVRSPYGVKIGKSVNVKSRTRLFEVKLPFPITVEHYAWFDDYSYAERDLHRQYHAKRLEGEWFDLSEVDIAKIKTLGKAVATDRL